MNRRALALVSVAALIALSSPGLAAAPTTIHASIVGLAAKATLGVPFPLTVKLSNRGPGVAQRIEVDIGVEKITGLGARPGLIAGPWMNAKRVVAVLAPGKSRKVSFKVTIAASEGSGATIGDTIFGPGGYWVGPAVMIGSPAGAKWTGAGTNASKPNVTLVAAGG